MTKRDLVGKIADVTQLHQEEVMTVVQKTLDYIAEELADGRCVELRNFGVFEIVVRRERKGRNPKTPTNIRIRLTPVMAIAVSPISSVASFISAP